MAAYGPEWIHTSGARKAVRYEEVISLAGVSELISKLLQCQPMWKDNAVAAGLQSKAPNSNLITVNTHGYLDKLPLWPTPKADFWHGNQEKVALRALATLSWLHLPTQKKLQQDKQYNSGCVTLKTELRLLLSRLLLGHLLDADTDMTKIIPAGMASIPEMLDLFDNDAPSTQMSVAFLLRVAHHEQACYDSGCADGSPREGGQAVAAAHAKGTVDIWRLFCEWFHLPFSLLSVLPSMPSSSKAIQAQSKCYLKHANCVSPVALLS